MNIEGTGLLWCYWHHYECDGGAENAFIKDLPGIFQISLQSSEVYSYTTGLFWGQYSWNDVLHFPEIKRFRIILKLPSIIISVYIVKVRVNVLQYSAEVLFRYVFYYCVCITSHKVNLPLLKFWQRANKILFLHALQSVLPLIQHTVFKIPLRISQQLFFNNFLNTIKYGMYNVMYKLLCVNEQGI